MAIKIPIHATATEALAIAARRSILPSQLGSAELVKMVEADLRRSVVFSAKTTSAMYLVEIRERIQRLLQGGTNNDWAKIRLELKTILKQLGYTPEKGFPGDDKLGIEPAEPGTLQDLSSDRRLNLLLDTQEKLMRGAAQKLRGEDGTRRDQFPAWELVRYDPREEPRDWVERWKVAGGIVLKDASGNIRLAAPKGSEVWGELGATGNFDDALDTDHPPFAFQSGMGWREMHWMEFEALTSKGGDGRSEMEDRGEKSKTLKPKIKLIQVPKVSTQNLDKETIEAIKKKIPEITQTGTTLSYREQLLERVRKEREAAVERLRANGGDL